MLYKADFISTPEAPAAIGPYSQGVKANGMLFVSGQLPIVSGESELKLDIREATKVSLSNVLAIVEAAGGKKENLIKLNVFMKDLNDFAEMNKVYAEFFGDHKPARAAVQVVKLPKDAVIEIEAVAYIPDL